jgi:hypothetical protein
MAIAPSPVPLGGSIKAHFDSDLATLQVGDAIDFVAVKFLTEGKSDIFEILDWSRLDGIILGVMLSSNTMCRIEGVAVIVAPGVALCAAHVLRDRAAQLQSGEVQSLCVGFSPGTRHIWGINHVAFVPGSDLAILSLTLVDGLSLTRKFKQASITTRVPRKGETLVVVGFKPNAIDCDNWQEGEKIRVTALACRGL